MAWQTTVMIAAAILGAAVAAILALDLVVYLRYGVESTISYGVWVASLEYHVIPYAFVGLVSFVTGFLACHFFGFDATI